MGTWWFIAWSSFVVGLSGAMMPGPVLTAAVSEVLRRGFWAGPLIVLGHGLLEVTVLGLLVTGFGDWLVLPGTRQVLGYAGGGLLLVMGVHMVVTARAAAEQALRLREQGSVAPVSGPVLAGVLTTMSNPYFYVWWGTIGLGYAALALEHGALGLGAFYGGHILADLAWYSLVALALTSGRRLGPLWLHRAVITGCGLALIGLGVWFVRYGYLAVG